VSGGLDETADAGTGTAVSTALAAGSYLGKYRLDRVLGEGGMGVVWAAHDPDLERAVAIKVLRYAQASQQLRQRLLREARAMAKLKHPNVLTVYEVGTVGDRDYIAMELVDGMTLDAWLALAPPAEQIWAAVLAAGHGLAAAHDAGVVHRDFKPHNVLRSREGRILVTDFGLARGMLAEGDSAALAADVASEPHVTPYEDTIEALAAPARPSSRELKGKTNDSLLDSPLTQTGALIGTPAYMAPEQYRGAPPDPRTDQFAFCVTAWQALTGKRPFEGQTLDELRRSASAGVAHVEARLPRGVRAVLARGLDPSAAQRWPSMDALLEALERAGKQPAVRRRWIAVLAGSAAFIALGLVLLAASRESARARTGCDDPDHQFVEAWSPAVKSALAQRTSDANVARIADQLDRYTERWIESYAKACRGRPAKLAGQRVACLEGIRDHAAAITTMLGDVDVRVLKVFEPRDALPPVTSCETASPLAPPRVPREQPRRGQILRVIGKSLALRGMPPGELGRAIDVLLAEAKALDWPPLSPLVLVSAGSQYERVGEPALARETFQRALGSLPSDAALRDVRVEGSIYLGLLESSLAELEDPHAPAPRGMTDPRAKAPLHGELAVRITKATNAAGSDPLLLGARSLLAANAYAAAAQWNRYPSGYEDALRLIGEARKLFDELGDVQRSAYAAYLEAQVYLMRGDDRALDDASFAARRAQDALAAAGLAPLPQLDQVRAAVAFARRDYKELYRLQQALGTNELLAAEAATIEGRVVGENAGAAVVVAWPADLTGNARTLAMNRARGQLVRVDRDGTFRIAANPDWAIMAETQDARSSPRLVGTGAVTLELEPTTTISGQVHGKSWFGVKAFARYAIGGRTWTLVTPIDKDGTFDLRGLPPGRRVYGTQGEAGTGERTILAGANSKAISWSYGQAIEIIVRAKQLDAGAQAWVVRGDHDVKTREDLARLVESASDVATSGLLPVGADNTDAGRDLYRAGDRHAVITGNSDGQTYTICASATAAGPLACKRLTVELTVAVEYPDGRFAGGVTPILFEL
jgi:tRNA A-37 threonylcarbamoyl transferase component Bud32/tetratricopeptide (TPR) repeat protein